MNLESESELRGYVPTGAGQRKSGNWHAGAHLPLGFALETAFPLMEGNFSKLFSELGSDSFPCLRSKAEPMTVHYLSTQRSEGCGRQ